MAFLKWLFALPFIIAAVSFAIANPDTISLSWSPFHNKLTLPVYALALGFLGLGFFLGSLMTWFGMGKVRSDRRIYKKDVKRLEKELKDKNSKKSEQKDPLLKQIEKDQLEIQSLIP